MIEIPESLTIAKQLNEMVQGKRILEVETEHSAHSYVWYSGKPDFYSSVMTGRIIGKSIGIGSMIEVTMDGYSFVVGDGTNIRYIKQGEKLPEKYQARITLEDESHLICKVQMYGAIFLIQPHKEKNPYYLAAKEKPLPNTEGFTYQYFKSLFDDISATMSMKAFLATEQRIPGLGNGVLQDILLEAGLHQKRKIGTITESGRRRIYESIVETLEKMTIAGGRNTEKDLFGNVGGYQTLLSKKTVGKPCPYCGSLIEKASYMGGRCIFVRCAKKYDELLFTVGLRQVDCE